MCELFGMNSDQLISINERASIFATHSVQQPDGWGIAAWEKDIAVVYHDTERAIDSEVLKKRLESPLLCCTSIMHLRRATVGKIRDTNCHPFMATDDTGRTWTLAHNGTVESDALIRSYFKKRAGTTDSEAVLLYLVDCINRATAEKGSSLTAHERILVLDEPIKELAHHNKINLLFYDSEQIYVHVNEKNTLRMLEEENQVTFMTVPFVKEELCMPVPENRLLVFKHGVKIYEGAAHFFEFFAWMIPKANLIPKE